VELDMRIVNVSKEMTSIAAMQTMIDFCVDKNNISSMYLNYDFKDSIISSVSSGDRNVFDYKIMCTMLQKLKNQYEENAKKIKQDIESFLKKNVKHFLHICPIEFISHPACSDNILSDIAKDKYSDISVKSVHSRETIGDKYSEYVVDNVYSGFPDKYGPSLAKIMLNVRNSNLRLSDGTKPNLEEICLVFAKGFCMCSNEQINNNTNVTDIHNMTSSLEDTIHSNPSYDNLCSKVYHPKNIYEEISPRTLNFLSKNFQQITKRVVPFFSIKNNQDVNKDTLKMISLYIDYEMNKQDKMRFNIENDKSVNHYISQHLENQTFNSTTADIVLSDNSNNQPCLNQLYTFSENMLEI
jgi:hypothetical protein